MAWLQSNLHIVDIQASHQTSSFCLEHNSGTKNVIAIALWQKLEMSIEGDCNLQEALHFAFFHSHEEKNYHSITHKKITIQSLPQSDNLSPLYRKHFTLPSSFPMKKKNTIRSLKKLPSLTPKKLPSDHSKK